MMRRIFVCFMVIAVVMVGTVCFAKKSTYKKSRDIFAAFTYPKLYVGKDKIFKSLENNLVIKNNGKKDEVVFFKFVKVPDNWEVELKHFGSRIGGIFVPSEDEKTIDFDANIKDKKKPLKKSYTFVVEVYTQDKKLIKKAKFSVEVGLEGSKEEEIQLNTSYPVLKGSVDSKFEFSLEVENKTGQEDLFNLKAEAPKDWEVAFKPQYEDKYISSIFLKPGQSKNLSLEIKPSPNAALGSHTVRVKIKSSRAEIEKELRVILTGTHKIRCYTLNGLLSLSAYPGKEANISLYIKNEGSAFQREISFQSYKPENWKVKFKPEKIIGLKPGQIKQVEILITPAKDALVGDYSVDINVQGEKASDDVEFRVTVKASTTWAWVGIAIIILVILGLIVTFKLLGRR